MKILNVGLFVLPQFIRSLIQNGANRNSILNITRCVYCLCPKVLCNVSFLGHCSCHFLQSPILSFYNSILLWSYRTREIMGNSICIKKTFKIFIFKFTTMITSNSNNLRVLFILHLSTEGGKYRVRLILASEELYPCPSAIIINNDQSILLAIE